jgi:hypothetical protein
MTFERKVPSSQARQPDLPVPQISEVLSKKLECRPNIVAAF